MDSDGSSVEGGKNSSAAQVVTPDKIAAADHFSVSSK